MWVINTDAEVFEYTASLKESLWKIAKYCKGESDPLIQEIFYVPKDERDERIMPDCVLKLAQTRLDYLLVYMAREEGIELHDPFAWPFKI